MESRKCSQCGAPIAEGRRFCTQCGTPVAAQQPQPQPQPQPQYNPPVPPVSQQPAYQQAPQPSYQSKAKAPADPKLKPMTIGMWIGTLILQAIPIVGFVFLIIWTCGGGGNLSRSNYARAMLILSAIGVVLFIVVCVILAATGSAWLSSMEYGLNSIIG